MSAVASLSWVPGVSPGDIDGDLLSDEDETDYIAGRHKDNSGLLHGGPSGLAVAEETGIKRRLGGQLNRVYGKVRKTYV